MSEHTLTDPKRPAGAGHTQKHGCCVREHDTLTEGATHAGHQCCEHEESSQATQSSCGCGTTRHPK